MKLLGIVIICAFILRSCCGYLPLVDYNIINDFKRSSYSIQNDQYLINNDSLNIKVKADVLIPNKVRSMKLNKNFVDLKLDIAKNIYPDTLKIKLNESNQVLIDDGKNRLNGQMKITNEKGDYQLIIFKTKYFIIYNSLVSGIIRYEFPYSNINKIDLNNHKLKINFLNLSKRDGTVLNLNEIICVYKKD